MGKGGSVPPLDPSMSCLIFMGWHEKTISLNSSLSLIAIAYANMSYKSVLGSRKFTLQIQAINAPQFYQMAGDSQNSFLKSPVGA